MLLHFKRILNCITFLFHILVNHRHHVNVEVASRTIPLSVDLVLLVVEAWVTLAEGIVLHVPVLFTLLLLHALGVRQLTCRPEWVDVGTRAWSFNQVFGDLLEEVTTDRAGVSCIRPLEFLVLLR